MELVRGEAYTNVCSHNGVSGAKKKTSDVLNIGH